MNPCGEPGLTTRSRDAGMRQLRCLWTDKLMRLHNTLLRITLYTHHTPELKRLKRTLNSEALSIQSDKQNYRNHLSLKCWFYGFGSINVLTFFFFF